MKHRYRHGVPFDISLHSGLISLVKPIGENALDAYTVKISVTSEGKSDSTRVRVVINDPSDPQPDDKDDKAKQVKQLREEFERENHAFKVLENSPGVLVANLTLLEFQSRGETAFLEYIITSSDAKDKFTITDNGLLYTKIGLDREEQDEYEITIAMGRRGIIRGREVLQVRVRVDDENDNSPSLDKHIYQGSIKEDAPPETPVDLDNPINVSDTDLNDEVRLQLLGKGSTLFRLDPESNEIILRAIGNSTKNVMSLSERTEDKKLYLRLRATDKAGHITESQVVIHVHSNKEGKTPDEIVVRGLSIIDGQYVKLIDNGGKGDLMVKETAPVGTKIAQLVITDQKSQTVQSGLKFVIIEETTDTQPNLFRLPKRQTEKNSQRTGKDLHFHIDSTNGYLSLLKKLSVRHKYHLKIQVTDDTGLTAVTTIEASVEDVNDHPPVFAKSSYEFRISEGSYTDSKIGEILASDGDVGVNAEIRFEISNYVDTMPIKLNAKDGTLLIDGTLNRETMSQIQFEVKATDRASSSKNGKSEDQVLESRVNVTVYILDVNDNAPTFHGYTRLRRKGPKETPVPPETGSAMISNIVPIYTIEIDAMLPPESEFFRVFANDSDVGLNGLVTFELLNHRDTFRVDAFTGNLFSLKKFNFEAQNLYDLSIVASDRGRPSLRSMAAVIVTIKQADPSVLPKPSIAQANPLVDSVKIDTKEQVNEQVPTITAKGKIFSEPEIVVEVLENIRSPANILDLKSVLNSEIRKQGDVSFDIIGSNFGIFKVDQRSSYLQMVESPNREQRDTYTLTLKSYLKPPSSEREVPVFFYTLYVQDTHNKQIAEDEIIIHVHIMDLNDNSPEFLTFENPVQTSVSSHLEAGALIAKMEAWDADKDMNANISYNLIHNNEHTKRLLKIHPVTGDVALMAPLINLPGHTLSLTVEAKDLGGAKNGLSAKVDLVIYILDNGFQLKMVLDNDVESVMKDVNNITNTLSALTGLNVKAYEVDEHKSVLEDQSNRKQEATDLLIYAVDESNKLISSASFIDSLTTKLPEAKARLSHHHLREVRAGGYIIDSGIGPKSPASKSGSGDSLGSLEIAVLGMACAVFFGAFIAMVCIFGIRARRRHAKNRGGYPAPLAIPLPSYSVEPNQGSSINTTTIHHPSGTTVGILHHGDIARQSLKSNSKYRTSM
jgi:protocadherin Fat 4